ncbi:exodeoxyribonuclease-3 [Desulfocicer vacuolatum DSM 3385]|uniref:Exodeoxyribonuclease-3 n=1 Tax=Desulfocicer vacuolatum DSM 3385 TaxID=1121400 RepID=A0A1W2DHC9_9BACT|nr:exodeoxyribonuclease III [Desulfocicer vacuolatum]SMC96532.1 exodeoxyribonuclease-3 [Desulfocicer vacuolatum DSM 3385]
MGKKYVKIISWNVNGLRAVLKKAFHGTVETLDPDILLLQETKLQAHQRTKEMQPFMDYHDYWAYSTVKKGYSGVAAYTRPLPESVKTGMGIPRYDTEGRILELDYEDFILFNVYFPNGQMSDERLQYKMDFYADFFAHAQSLRDSGKSLIITGDFNIAHNEIDLKNPGPNSKRSGFLPSERKLIDDIIAHGYVDTFRFLHPDAVEYSWWSYRFNARKNNAGWRIDYFFVTQDIIDKGWLKTAFIGGDVLGSDHCPVGITLEM